MSRLTTVVASGVLVARRRGRHDLGQLLTTVAMVALTSLVAVIAPAVVLTTLDLGAGDAVERAGQAADIVAEFTVGELTAAAEVATPDEAVAIADAIPGALAPALRSMVASSTLTVLSTVTTVRAIDGAAAAEDDDSRLMVRIGMITPQNSAGFELQEGRQPAARSASSREPIEVVVSRAAADSASIGLGTVLDLGVQPTEGEETVIGRDRPVTTLVVVGIAVEDGDAPAGLWEDSPEVWSPTSLDSKGTGPAVTRFTVLAGPDGIAASALFLSDPVVGSTRLRIDPSALTFDRVDRVIAQTSDLIADGQVLNKTSAVSVSARSSLPAVLAAFTVESRAALAQMSLMMSGVLGVAAVTLVLQSRLLVLRRAAAVGLERARGSSLASIAFRALLEALVTTAVGAAVGLIAAVAAAPGGLRDPLPLVAVILVALLAGPVQTVIIARELWTGRRDPANRRDRELLARRRRRQRVVVEVAVIVVAAASVLAVRTRGLLQNRTGGIDPLLAAAPLLLAIAVTIVVVRLYPYPVRIISSFARRTRGPLGLLGAVRALSAVAALPLLALSLGAALSVTGASLVDTVRGGQNDAAWERVGATARVDAPLDAAAEDSLRTAPGVDGVSGSRSRGGVGLDIGTSSTTVTVISVDAAYADVVDAVPEQPSTESLRLLASPGGDGESLAVVVDQDTADRLVTDDIAMYFGPSFIPLTVVGVSEVAPEGYLEGPFAFVDIDALNGFLPEPQAANRYLIVGENDGVNSAVAELTVGEGSVLTRTGWIEDRRSLALVAGVERAMIVSVAAVALLSLIGLIATVVGGARARGRALSLLRTLGMRPRLGWWLALAELGPLIAAAIIGGIIAGLVVTLSIAPAVGLDVLAGGTSVPTISLSPAVYGVLLGAGVLLLVVGALADVLVHRRDRLSDVLRVGETV